MYLYVLNKQSNKKTYLKPKAGSKRDFANMLGSEQFLLKEQVYSVADIVAQHRDNMYIGAAIGGIVGIIAGIPGIVIGSIVGAMVDKNKDVEDRMKTQRFNLSTL